MKISTRGLVPTIAIVATLAMAAAGCGPTAPAGTPFTITGSVQDLTPGVQGTLELTAHNPNSVPISVSSLKVDTSRAPAGCPASNLTTTNFTGTLDVPANGTAKKSLPISLAATAPDACQNVAFSLTYTGAATYTQTFSTHTALASSPNPSTVDQPVTFTAEVEAGSPAPGRPTGSVTFSDGTVVLGTINVGRDGKATLVTSRLTLGSHSITAAYGGDPNFGVSTSAAITQQVRASHSK